MQAIPLLCAIISIFSGLMGYRFAIEQAPELARAYAIFLTLQSILHIVFASLISNRKDRILRIADPKKNLNIRKSLSAILATLLLGISLLLGWLTPGSDFIFKCLALYALTQLFQYATYTVSAHAHVLKPEIFWRNQLIGASTRALFLLTIVVWLQQNYVGIVASNTASAISICALYGEWPSFARSKMHATYRALRRGATGRLFTMDGLLRAAKGQYESLATSVAALIFSSIFLSPAGSMALPYISVGYLNAEQTALRQTLAWWELKGYGAIREQIRAVAAAIGIVAVCWLLFERSEPVKFLLPHLGLKDRRIVLESASVAFIAYPLTRGFLYADYLAREALHSLWIRLIIAFFASELLVIALNSSVCGRATGIWNLPVQVAIAIAMRGGRCEKQ